MPTQTPNPEYRYETACFMIRTITNLHAGSGSENYGIIDNLIQRDAATNFPCILASSLKGALREFFRNYLGGNHDRMIHYIFGKEKKQSDAENGSAEEAATAPPETLGVGKYRFLQADLLSLPVRSDKKLYFNATCPWIIGNLTLQLQLLQKRFNDEALAPVCPVFSEQGICFEAGTGTYNAEPDDILIHKKPEPPGIDKSRILFGNELAIVKNEHFTEAISDYNLPVIARNNLNDGQSANLWYEQVLPRETRLLFFVLYPSHSEQFPNYFDDFKKAIVQYPVQIGANASVGYGFCEIVEIPLSPSTV